LGGDMTAIRGRIIPEPAPQEHHTAGSPLHTNIYYGLPTRF
jgi:hypothetical protein